MSAPSMKRGPGRPAIHSRNSPFGELLRASRRACGLSVEEVARQVSRSVGLLYKLEQGAIPPPSDGLISQLAVCLGIEPDRAFHAAGRLTPDLVSTFEKRPELTGKLIRKANALGPTGLSTILDRIEEAVA